MRRLALAVAVGAAALAVGASSASATSECRGFDICVPVAGPWVVTPAGERVEFQLKCPRKFVVGGLDAELSSRAIDIAFLGKLGSPVGPGVTTGRSLVFVATYAGTRSGGASFRPHLGCLPAAGGGGGPVPYRPSAGVPPGEPTVRRVRTVGLHPGTIRAGQGCGRGEFLVSGWHAVGFYTARPPDPALATAVAAARSLRGGRVAVVARATATVGGVRAILQVGAVCGGAR